MNKLKRIFREEINGKRLEELKRYNAIVDYINENPDRKDANILCLLNIRDYLNANYPHQEKIDVSDKDFQKKIAAFCKNKEFNDIYETANHLEEIIARILEDNSESKGVSEKVGGMIKG